MMNIARFMAPSIFTLGSTGVRHVATGDRLPRMGRKDTRFLGPRAEIRRGSGGCAVRAAVIGRELAARLASARRCPGCVSADPIPDTVDVSDHA
jgi:hypothetical protein